MSDRQKKVRSGRKSRRPQKNVIADTSKNTILNTESKTIISESIVKYSTVIQPTSVVLPVNTDLKLPPLKWLSATEIYGVQKNMSFQSGFSSFEIADKFIDCINKVDIMSDAENIKQLLKIPFSTNSVSMMVHRVGDTLLIDEFNASKHLIMETQKRNWNWLKQFFSDHIFKSGEVEKYISHRVNSLNVLQEKTLNSKFLHYSIADSPNSSNNNNYQQQNTTKSKLDLFSPCKLPQPNPEDQFPDYPNVHNFNQTMLWTFGDIKMLIGSDLPIFKHETCSSQSLRLKDSSKPMNVLTKIDYWLDNLMCNVSEVLLCHHLDGIVQKYEKVKTEDLPNFEDTFLPQTFKFIAHNLSLFLKSKISKMGHTYWLYKGKNETMIKTYDLTSLCFEPLPQDQNPYSNPIAMLLYRVAHTWLYSPVDEEKEFSSIKSFLQNSLKLLNKTEHPLINTSINYMLAELYIPSDFEESPTHMVKLFWGFEDLVDQNYYEPINSTDIFNLCISHNEQNTSSKSEHSELNPVELSEIERCHKSFYNIGYGLQSLNYIIETKVYKSELKVLNESNIASSSSSNLNPIITKIYKKNKKKIEGSDMNNKILPCPFDNLGIIWKYHFRGLFLKKAIKLILILSYNRFQFDSLGSCLKLLHLGVECQLRISTFDYNHFNFGCLFQQTGNCCLKIAKSWKDIQKHKMDHEIDFDFTLSTVNFLENEYDDFSDKDLNIIPCNLDSKLDMLEAAENCYKRSLEFNVDEKCRPFIINDIGAVHEQYILFNIEHILNALENSILLTFKTFQSIIRTSVSNFVLAIDCYKQSCVIKSQSILYLNMGFLYSLASVYVVKFFPDNGILEHIYGKKASEYFDLSHEVLGDRSCQVEDRDYCYLNLFSCSYSVAERYFSLCINSKAQSIDVKAIYWLKKSMTYYNSINEASIRKINAFNVAEIASKLGDLYFKQLIQCDQNSPNLRSIIQLCSEQYDIGYDLYFMIGYSYKALGMMNRKLFLEEIQSTHGFKSQIECCITTIQHLEKGNNLLYKAMHADANSNDLKTLDFDTTEFFEELEKRMSFVLKYMTKLSTDETSILASQSDKMKTIYRTFIQKECEDNFRRFWETIKQVTEMKLK